MTKLSNMIDELSKKQFKQHDELSMKQDTLYRVLLQKIKDKLANQRKAITDLDESLNFLGKDLKDGQDENKAIKKEIGNVKLIYEELTKKMAEI